MGGDRSEEWRRGMGCGGAGVLGWHQQFRQRRLGCRLGSRRRIVSVWDGSHAVLRRGRRLGCRFGLWRGVEAGTRPAEARGHAGRGFGPRGPPRHYRRRTGRRVSLTLWKNESGSDRTCRVVAVGNGHSVGKDKFVGGYSSNAFLDDSRTRVRSTPHVTTYGMW